MRAYYNENDGYCCDWLSNLMDASLLTPGKIDERDIREVQPADVEGFEQVHLFAGIGGWPLALQWAGWEGPVWTGSCPCQPFSSAGKRGGESDEQHLWPAFWRLIAECRPATVDGFPKRLDQIRAYGNAIVPQVAAEFIRAYMGTGG